VYFRIRLVVNYCSYLFGEKMINWVETFHYYVRLLKESDQNLTHNLIKWYQDRCRYHEA